MKDISSARRGEVGAQQRTADQAAAALKRGGGRSNSRQHLKQDHCKAPEQEGVYGPRQDNERTALLQKERDVVSLRELEVRQYLF